MKELMTSPYFGVGLSVVAFWIGEKLHNKLKTPICNPLIVAIVLIVGVLLIFDMYQITKIAEEKGLTTSGCAEQIKKALEIYKLPDNSNLPIDVLTDAISLDKKNLNNHLNVVLLHDIGDSYVDRKSVV